MCIYIYIYIYINTEVRVQSGGQEGVLRVPFAEPVTERKDIISLSLYIYIYVIILG